jgi:uncharacterized small protein (DUF1192 family)
VFGRYIINANPTNVSGEKMSLMSVAEVADFLSVQETRVLRLERESLLLAKEKDAADQPMFDEGDVAKYKELAERLGGL